jgi:hypothetical protein
MRTIKTVNVVMLPTEKASEGCILRGIGTLQHHPKEFFTQEYLKSSGRTSEHLYLTSDEEIKKGDWYIVLPEGFVRQYKNKNVPLKGRDFAKIIATTDKSLIVDKFHSEVKIIGSQTFGVNSTKYVPQISESFVKAYVEANGNIKEVLVELKHPVTILIPNPPLKLRPDNTVIIHQAKLYTRDEVEKLCEKAFQAGVDLEANPEQNPMFASWIQYNL